MRRCSAILGIWVLLSAPFANPQNKPQALLHPTNNVTVNGNRILSDTTLFNGDSVRTGANSAATISGRGVQITAAANSSLVFHESTVELGCGNVSVTGDLATKAGEYAVALSKPGRYELLQHNGKLKILAKAGEVKVTKGASDWVIPAGGTLVQTVVGLCVVTGASGALPGALSAATSAAVLGATTGDLSPSIP